ADVLDQNTLEVISTANSAEEPAKKAVSSPAEAPVEGDIGALYRDYRMRLVSVACRKFRIPEIEAENLIQEVFLSFLQAGTKIENAKAWLVAANGKRSR